MKFIRLLIASLILLSMQQAIGATFESNEFSIDVPSGFQGPESMTLDTRGITTAFKKPHPGGPRSAVLQMTVYDFGAQMPAISKEHLGDGAESYLLQFLKGVERNTISFSGAAPIRISLGGLPSARVSWTGIVGGRAMQGIMYCTVNGSKVVSFHAQDFQDAPPADLKQAVNAIESVRFKHSN